MSEQENKEVPNYLDMSDEDFLKEDLPVPKEVEQTIENGGTPPNGETDTPPTVQVEDKVAEPPTTPPEQVAATKQGGSPADVAATGTTTPTPPPNGQEDKAVVVDNGFGIGKAVERTSEADTAIVDKLFAPIKASGTNIQVKSVDEAIQLIQMGANYQKKMQTIKPKMRVLQTLERHQVDDAKLNYALDLLSGNKEAIHKLVTEHGYEQDGFFNDNGNAPVYTPTDNLVSPQEVEVRDAFNEIEGSPHASRVQSILTKEWDADSANEFIKNPRLITTLNAQMEAGHFAAIESEMVKQRALHGHTHMNDLELYCAIGDAMVKSGQLVIPSNVATPPTHETVIAPKPSTAATAQPQGNANKVAPTVSTQSQKTTQPDWLSMSDADFLKQSKGNA